MTSSEGRLLFHITILSEAKDLIVKILPLRALRPVGPEASPEFTLSEANVAPQNDRGIIAENDKLGRLPLHSQLTKSHFYSNLIYH